MKMLKAGQPMGQCKLDSVVLRKRNPTTATRAKTTRFTHSLDSPSTQKQAAAMKGSEAENRTDRESKKQLGIGTTTMRNDWHLLPLTKFNIYCPMTQQFTLRCVLKTT